VTPTSGITPTITPTFTPTSTPVRAEGCSAVFWQQKNHLACWPTPYTQTTVVSTVFAIPACLTGCTYGSGKNAVGILDLTFIQVLGLGSANGTAADLCDRTGYLLREGVAALLNAQDPLVSFPRTTSQIISAVNGTLATCDPQAIRSLGDELDALNKAGCRLEGRDCGTLRVPFRGN